MKTRNWVAAISIGFVLGLGACGGSSSKTAGSTASTVTVGSQNVAADRAAAKAAALKLSDLPSGWTARARSNLDVDESIVSELTNCLGVPASPLPRAVYASPEFLKSYSSGYRMTNTVIYWPRGTDQTSFGILLSSRRTPECLSTGFTALLRKHPVAGVTVGTIAVSPLSLPQFGDKSVVYEFQIPITDNGREATAYLDGMYSIKGRARVSATFGAEGDPFPTDQIQHYSELVVSRLTNT
jgi:hypothetical protein